MDDHKKYVDFDSVLNTKHGCHNDKFRCGPLICIVKALIILHVQVSIQFTHT